MEKQPIQTLGPYQILGELGRGGCGVVYLASDPRIGRKVAIKTIDANGPAAQSASLRERFRREARAAGILSHPHIVTIHEFNEAGDVLYLVMEYIEGQTLADRMSGAEPLSPDFIISMLRPAAEALDFAHSREVIHRDVKPANFLITKSGQLKVADFGIAKIADGDTGLTKTGMMIGTAQYMSPEQVYAKGISGRSDQFSLAVIAYEMIAGTKPFDGDSWPSLLHQIISVDPPPVSQYRADVPAGVTEVLRKGLAKDPAERYPSCQYFVDQLTRALLGTAVWAAMEPSVTRTMNTPFSAPAPTAAASVTPAPTAAAPTAAAPPPAARASIIRPVAIGGTAAVILFGGWLVFHQRPTPPAPAAPPAVTEAKPTAAPVPTASAPVQEPPAKEKAPVRKEFKTPVPPPQVAQRVSPAPAEPAPALAAPPPLVVQSTPPQVIEQPVVQPPKPTPPPAPPARPAEAEVWNQLANSTDVAALQKFRQDYPGGAYFAEAGRRIEQVEWDKASRAGDAKSLRDFLSKYPAGAFADRAKAELAKFDKAAETASTRALVTAALDRYRAAFEKKDIDGLKNVWPSLGRAELNSIQNFFAIARSIKLELRALGDAEISGDGAIIRCRRIVTASDNRGPLPVQDQVVSIRLRKTADGMVIQSVDAAGR